MPTGTTTHFRLYASGDKGQTCRTIHHAGSHSGHQRLLGLFIFNANAPGDVNDFGRQFEQWRSRSDDGAGPVEIPHRAPADRHVGKRPFCCSSISRV